MVDAKICKIRFKIADAEIEVVIAVINRQGLKLLKRINSRLKVPFAVILHSDGYAGKIFRVGNQGVSIGPVIAIRLKIASGNLLAIAGTFAEEVEKHSYPACQKNQQQKNQYEKYTFQGRANVQ